MMDLGLVEPGATIYIPFGSYASGTGAPSAMTALAVGDILVYKDGSITQRASTSGFTLLDTDGLDFDALTGINGISISLADNTTAGFWAAGSRYWVVISPVTVDGQTMSFIAAIFKIGLPGATLNTTIATLASQTSFTLTVGPAEDDALNGCRVYIHDVASAVQGGFAIVADYTGSTKTVTLVAATTYTAAATDNISVFPPALVPTTFGRTLDVSATGEAGVDWANVGSPTTALNLSATNIDVDQVVASVSGAVGSVTGAVGSVTGLTNATIADAVLDEDMTAHQTLGTLGQAIGDPVADTNTIYKAVVTDATGATVGVDVVAVKTDTAAILIDTAEIGAAGAGLTAIDLPNQTMDITGTITTATNVTTVNDKTGYALSAAGSAALTEGYGADGAAATLPQLLYMLLAVLTEASVSGTTLTAKKLDGIATAATFTLNDGTNPTSITRAT